MTSKAAGSGMWTKLLFFTALVVFARPARAQCEDVLESDEEGYSCLKESLVDGYDLHWQVTEAGVDFLIEAQTVGWVALGFPETPGIMVGAQAVLCWKDVDADSDFIEVRDLTARSPAGILESNAFTVSGTEVEEAEGSTKCKFTRDFDEEFLDDGSAIDLLTAYNADGVDDIVWHGPVSRGGSSVALFGCGCEATR